MKPKPPTPPNALRGSRSGVRVRALRCALVLQPQPSNALRSSRSGVPVRALMCALVRVLRRYDRTKIECADAPSLCALR
eukprot:7675855-Alexandrium_andersonii.AAC.1